MIKKSINLICKYNPMFPKIIYNFYPELPKPHNLKWTKEQKKVLFSKQSRKKKKAKFHDILQLPFQQEGQIETLYYEFIQKDNTEITSQNIAFMIYNFTKYQLMTPTSFLKFMPHVEKFKGQYKLRATFGGLYGGLVYNNTKIINFFLEEFEASDRQFTLYQVLELVQALNLNNDMPIEEKQDFWYKYLKNTFKDGIVHVKDHSMKRIFRVFDAIVQLQDYDEEIFNQLFRLMSFKKRPWTQVSIIQRLYPLTGTFQTAKSIFDEYYVELSTNQLVQKFFNLQQLRYYSNSELVKRQEQQPSDYYPKNRTMVPEDQKAQEWNEKYEEWRIEGAYQEKGQIIQEKANSFVNNLRKRYSQLKKDGFDLSNINEKQFQDLFGEYNKEMFTSTDILFKKNVNLDFLDEKQK